MCVCVFASSQARRRTTTQMELLYANSSESTPDSTTGELSGAPHPLAETPEGAGELDSSVISSARDRDRDRDRDLMAPASGFSSKLGSM